MSERKNGTPQKELQPSEAERVSRAGFYVIKSMQAVADQFDVPHEKAFEEAATHLIAMRLTSFSTGSGHTVPDIVIANTVRRVEARVREHLANLQKMQAAMPSRRN